MSVARIVERRRAVLLEDKHRAIIEAARDVAFGMLTSGHYDVGGEDGVLIDAGAFDHLVEALINAGLLEGGLKK